MARSYTLKVLTNVELHRLMRPHGKSNRQHPRAQRVEREPPMIKADFKALRARRTRKDEVLDAVWLHKGTTHQGAER